jgi:hypothetical protein
MLFAGIAQDPQALECPGLFVAKKKRVGITLLAFARDFFLPLFQMLPGLSRPSAGRINLEVLFPGIHRQVPCLCFLLGNGQVKEGAGLIVAAQVRLAQDFA